MYTQTCISEKGTMDFFKKFPLRKKKRKKPSKYYPFPSWDPCRMENPGNCVPKISGIPFQRAKGSRIKRRKRRKAGRRIWHLNSIFSGKGWGIRSFIIMLGLLEQNRPPFVLHHIPGCSVMAPLNSVGGYCPFSNLHYALSIIHTLPFHNKKRERRRSVYWLKINK